MKCPNCSQIIEENLSKCPYCLFELPCTQQQAAVTPAKDIEYYKKTYGVDDYYAKRFREIDANGGNFSMNFNIYAFIFGAFWYIYKGMWQKALAIFILVFLLEFVIGLGASTVGISVAIALTGTYDFYLKTVARVEVKDLLLSKNPHAVPINK